MYFLWTERELEKEVVATTTNMMIPYSVLISKVQFISEQFSFWMDGSSKNSPIYSI